MSFVGRAQELGEVERLLERERAVTLVGAPGMGKSRLAAELARRRAGVYVELAGAPDEEGASAAVALALGGRPEDPPGALLAERGPTLLVLDEPVAAPLARWLEAAAELRLLCAARARLGFSGERTFELGPMAGADAVELLARRARAARHDCSSSAEDLVLLGEIARELDGIPQALELAAERLALMGPAALLERLRTGQRVVGGPLERALAESVRDLSPQERSALAQCAVFRGGFSVEAAEAVLSLGGAPVLDVLQSLRHKSLLRAYEPQPGELRLGLYAVVAAAVAAEADSGAIERHGAHFLGHADLDREHDNVLAAIDRAPGDPRAVVALLTVDRALRTRLPLGAHLRRLGAALERELDAPTRLRLHEARARALRRAGRSEEALAELARALPLATGPAEQAALAHQLGGTHVALEQYEAALPELERCAALRRACGDDAGAALALLSIAHAHTELGRSREALAEVDRAWALLGRGDWAAAAAATREQAILLLTAAQALREIDAARSEGLLVRAAVAFERLGERWFSAAALIDLGSLRHERGERTPETFERALELASGIDPRLEALALAHLAAVRARLGEMDVAQSSLRRAERRLEPGGAFALAVHALGAAVEPARDLAPAQRHAPRSYDVRVALRLVAGGGAIVVARSGRSLRLPTGERVDLSRRRSLRLVLLALAERHACADGAPLALDALFAAGWPGERAALEAGHARVYTAIRILRSLGLKEALLRRDDGYLLDPKARIVWSDD